MFPSTWTTRPDASYEKSLDRLAAAIGQSDAVLVGAGAGLSVAAGFAYSGQRFEQTFADFHDRFGITDMYAGGFYPFPDAETTWAWWSRMVWVNRYACPVGDVYRDLLDCVRDRDYFVLTTNVDHQFQRTGFDKHRLFYTQGDYGLFQCSVPCHQATYDNRDQVERMLHEQQDMRVPTELVPRCPVCGEPMTMNLRADDRFVQDEGWYAAARRYEDFLHRHEGLKVVLLELGVGNNTPGIIRYPFWRMAAANPTYTYAQVKRGRPFGRPPWNQRRYVVSHRVLFADALPQGVRPPASCSRMRRP